MKHCSFLRIKLLVSFLLVAISVTSNPILYNNITAHDINTDTPSSNVVFADAIVNECALCELKNTPDATQVKIYNDAIVLGQQGNYLYLKDVECGFGLAYGDCGQTYNLGDVIPAGYGGVKTTYDGEPELKNLFGFQPAMYNIGSSALDDYAEVTTVSKVGHENWGHYVRIDNITINKNSFTFTDETGSITFFDRFRITWPDDMTKTYTVYAIVATFKLNYQLLPVRVCEDDVFVTDISLNVTNMHLIVNQTFQLTTTITPNWATNKTVKWNSSNNSVATVSQSGLVTATAPGNTTITATTIDGSNLSASCDVTVSIIPATSISLNKAFLTLDISDTYQLVPTLLPIDATYKTLTWESSNTSVATVSNNGLITPVAPGDVTITATTIDGTNLSASCQVTVVKRVKSISLNEDNLTLSLPETAQLIASITPNDATNGILNWTSSKPSVAAVDNNGFITSKSVGTTTITATTTDGSNLSATCLVIVSKQNVTSIMLNKDSLKMHIGETFQLIADVLPENASNPALKWNTNNPSIASVDNNGLVTALSGGTTYINTSTTDGSNLTASCAIEVLPDYYLSLDSLSHIRGMTNQIVDLPLSLINKNPISGIQFDVTLPNDVEFNLVDGYPEIWLDDARKTRSHSVAVSRLDNRNYRVLVSSSASKELKGNEGVLLHMNMLLPQMHDTGIRYINISNIIASEADETRHTLDNKSVEVYFYYIVGDADANTVVDIADYMATASKILSKFPSPFFGDAANVDNNNSLDVVDLVGITNIALGIKPITVRQAPIREFFESRLFCDKLNIRTGGEQSIALGCDCGFDFAGFQIDISLPQGLKVTDISLGEGASGLGLTTEVMTDGKIRILGTSFSDVEINGACNKLLILNVTADRSYMLDSDIEFSNIIFAERNMTTHSFDELCIERIETSSLYELMDEVRIHVENGNIYVDTPLDGVMQLIAVDGRMIEYKVHVGHNVFETNSNGIHIINFNGKTIKVQL